MLDPQPSDSSVREQVELACRDARPTAGGLAELRGTGRVGRAKRDCQEFRVRAAG